MVMLKLFDIMYGACESTGVSSSEKNNRMKLYIHSAGIISAAGNNNADEFLVTVPTQEAGTMWLCREPDYSHYIPAMQLRRMSKAVRMGIGASKIALQKAGIEKPDAFSVGTAYGCLQDTEVFLSKMVNQQEQMLTPTAFIQSTHNTVAGQIALLHGCKGHNLTFVHRGHSFEQAMINTTLYLSEHPQHTVLVGGIDELTTTADTVLQSFGKTNNAEGSSFFAVSNQSSSVCVHDITTLTTKNTATIAEAIEAMLQRHQWTMDDIDAVLVGVTGDATVDTSYKLLTQQIFQQTPQLSFKNLCGDYPTATAFALGLLLECRYKGFPGECIINQAPKSIGKTMIVSNYEDFWSIWLVQCEG